MTTKPTMAATDAANKALDLWEQRRPTMDELRDIIDAEFSDVVAALRSFVDPWSAGGPNYMAKLDYDTFSRARSALTKLDIA